MRHAVVITAAGSSRRFNENSGSTQKKEFSALNGHSLLYKATEPFTQIEGLCAVVITYLKGTEAETKRALEDLPERVSVPFVFVEGGKTRQQSVFNALKKLSDRNEELKIDYVSIHDGARPFVSKELIGFTLASAMTYGAAAPAVTVSDTLVRKDANGFICGQVDRTGVCRIQTPQIFKFDDIYEAHSEASVKDKEYTDDTSVFIDFGKKVALVEGAPDNIKITYRKDLC